MAGASTTTVAAATSIEELRLIIHTLLGNINNHVNRMLALPFFQC